MGLTKQRGHSVHRGIAAVRAEEADAAMERLYSEYVRMWRARKAEELRKWKLEQIFKSPAATARLRFLERQDEARRQQRMEQEQEQAS